MPSRARTARSAPYSLFHVEGSPFWYFYFLDREGRRVRRSTKEADKGRAHAVAREFERRLRDPTYQAAHSTTVGDAAGNLKAALENRGKAPATRSFYDQKLRHVTRLFGKDAPLASVTAAAVDDYIKVRRREGAHSSTISKELTALRMLLKVARRRGEYALEVSQVLPVGFATGYVPRVRRVTREQAWQLISVLPGDCGRYTAFVCATTARDSAVKRAIGRDLKDGCIFVRDRKTKQSCRDVPLTAITGEFAKFAFKGVAPDASVAPGVSSVRHAFARACKRLGWAPLSPNDLRRSVAHWLLEEGVRRDVTAAFMGHGSTRMLDLVYGKLETEEIGEAIARALVDHHRSPERSP